MKQYPSEELQLLSQHLFLVEQLTFCFKPETAIKGCAQTVRRHRPGFNPRRVYAGFVADRLVGLEQIFLPVFGFPVPNTYSLFQAHRTL
jgi:hypothetical protein